MAKQGKSVSNWQPTEPTKTNQSLMKSNAKDNPDTFGATNELKQWVGGKGKVQAPFGKMGREF